ncbi:hypothetical protein P153DRAFT_387436 [Dothidotthia symphoricarpi CBS 119687]|uniref:Mid2 domain-containing protein n=1 Tax=Dothidotthia symphoricarpi CBS 119687 TaxID=1392245 RepID=A0A6A6A939_9PLEO|nr:uncharacterized protein P153DRAFT_387436 [Dothidotthia symphoricarpi CBS 119687]KAF2127703.1 hypothetical protein P153DRAFT_387436 [Dothidotthia symphoricarpi CBS 119687]
MTGNISLITVFIRALAASTSAPAINSPLLSSFDWGNSTPDSVFQSLHPHGVSPKRHAPALSASQQKTQQTLVAIGIAAAVTSIIMLFTIGFVFCQRRKRRRSITKETSDLEKIGKNCSLTFPVGKTSTRGIGEKNSAVPNLQVACRVPEKHHGAAHARLHADDEAPFEEVDLADAGQRMIRRA